MKKLVCQGNEDFEQYCPTMSIVFSEKMMEKTRFNKKFYSNVVKQYSKQLIVHFFGKPSRKNNATD